MQQEMIEKSFDFSVRIVELIRFLKEEGTAFPLAERLLLCATGIGVTSRLSELCNGKEKTVKAVQAFAYAVECGYLLELMAKTGYLTEIQSKPLRSDCAAIKAGISWESKGGY